MDICLFNKFIPLPYINLKAFTHLSFILIEDPKNVLNIFFLHEHQCIIIQANVHRIVHYFLDKSRSSLLYRNNLYPCWSTLDPDSFGQLMTSVWLLNRTSKSPCSHWQNVWEESSFTLAQPFPSKHFTGFYSITSSLSDVCHVFLCSESTAYN